jgi:hypothetical protein
MTDEIILQEKKEASEDSVAFNMDSYRYLRSPTMFWFPRNVNVWTTRLVALQVVVLCIVTIIFRDRVSVHYTIAAQLIDFILR